MSIKETFKEAIKYHKGIRDFCQGILDEEASNDN